MVSFTIQCFLKKHWEVLPFILKKLLHVRFYHTVVLKTPYGYIYHQVFIWKAAKQSNTTGAAGSKLPAILRLLSNILVKQQKLVRSRDIFQILIRTTYNSTPMGIFSTNQGGITKDTPSSTSIPRRGEVVIDVKKNLSQPPRESNP